MKAICALPDCALYSPNVQQADGRHRAERAMTSLWFWAEEIQQSIVAQWQWRIPSVAEEMAMNQALEQAVIAHLDQLYGLRGMM
jgi:hypothetical protein